LSILRDHKIVLIDGTQLIAGVKGISEKYDIALLKLDGYKCPTLSLSMHAGSPQDSLYAIGMPWVSRIPSRRVFSPAPIHR